MSREEDLEDYGDDIVNSELERQVWRKCLDPDQRRLPFFKNKRIKKAVLHGVSTVVHSGALYDVIEKDTRGTDFVVLPEYMVSCCLRKDLLERLRSWEVAGMWEEYNLIGNAAGNFEQTGAKNYCFAKALEFIIPKEETHVITELQGLAPPLIDKPGRFLNITIPKLNQHAMNHGSHKGFLVLNDKTIARGFGVNRAAFLDYFMDPALHATKLDRSQLGYIILAENYNGYNGHAYGVGFDEKRTPIIFSPDEGAPRHLRPSEFGIAKVTRVWELVKMPIDKIGRKKRKRSEVLD